MSRRLNMRLSGNSVTARAVTVSSHDRPTERGITLTPLTFWIPRPPDNANSRGHSRQANRVKKAYWGALDVRQATGIGIPDPPPVPLAHVELHSCWHHGTRRNFLDADNAIRRLKPFVDWLVRERYLAGDKYENVRWFNPEQTTVPPDGPPMCSVRVVLSELRSVPVGAA